MLPCRDIVPGCPAPPRYEEADCTWQLGRCGWGFAFDLPGVADEGRIRDGGILCIINFLDTLPKSQLVHTTVQCLLNQSTVVGDRFIETVAAGEIIGVKPEPGQNPAGDIAAQAALTDHIDRLFWIQFRNAIS